MKVAWRAAVGAAALHTAAHAWAVLYGPAECVALRRSSSGTCTITTNCEGQDTSHFEFAFDCLAPNNGGVVRHSFGLGGFDPNEEFDTEVVCDKCSPPMATAVAAAAAPPVDPVKTEAVAAARQQPPAAQPAAIAMKAKSSLGSTVLVSRIERPGLIIPAMAAAIGLSPSSRTSDQKDQPPAVVHYGPKGCVSTFKSQEGHCIMQTRCADEDIKDYSFGLVCVDKIGLPVRHLFGQDSFDPEETFDTLIPCDQCLGLDDIPDAVAVNGQVVALTQEIRSLEVMMQNISESVEKLNEKVFAPRNAQGHEVQVCDSCHNDVKAAKEEAPKAQQEQAVQRTHHFLARHHRFLRHHHRAAAPAGLAPQEARQPEQEASGEPPPGDSPEDEVPPGGAAAAAAPPAGDATDVEPREAAAAPEVDAGAVPDVRNDAATDEAEADTPEEAEGAPQDGGDYGDGFED